MNITEFANQWLASQIYKHSTLQTYRDALRFYIAPAFGERELGTINKMDLDLFRKNLAAKVTGSRVNVIISFTRTLFAAAADNKLIDFNPAEKLKRVKVTKKALQPLTPEEVKAALEKVDPFYKPIFTFLAQTGARPSEALALHWDDVDFENKQIRIDGGRVGTFESTTKTAAGNRVLHMSSAVHAALQSLGVRGPQDFVFMSKGGGPLNGHNLSRIWQRAMTDAGIESETTAYMIRHAFLSNALQNNIDITYVSRIAGHANAGVTLGIYNRLLNSTIKTETAKLAQLLG